MDSKLTVTNTGPDAVSVQYIDPMTNTEDPKTRRTLAAGASVDVLVHDHQYIILQRTRNLEGR